ncbi:MAG TPA: PilZ domain-containing protein, partial [Candidatus Acidoferrum sp.]|nr:PilZ domain-containing protein [Candidatus Acidoferrum sp.]
MDASTAGSIATPAGVGKNRRLYPRRRIRFPASFTLDGNAALPAFALDLSGGGLKLFTQEPLKGGTRPFSLVALFDGRRITCRAIRRWSQAIETPSGIRYQHGVQLRGIADGDWDFLMNRVFAPGGDQATPGGVLTAGQLNAMLSFEKQHRIAEALTEAGRLTYDRSHRLPLIEYAFGGYTMQRGAAYYRFTIRSKVSRPRGI